MSENKYLPIGTTIASKYEVIDVLGEDDFEILYLVRDLNRKGSFFVLKELFLETFSSREEELVFTVPEALGVFHKRKKQIMEEINTQTSSLNPNEIQVYGYEDENNTIYTIMEFSSDASLKKYLQFEPKSVEELPMLNKLVIEEKKSFSMSFFLKILLFLGIILTIAFYSYQFYQKSSIEQELKINHPVLKDRIEKHPIIPPKKEKKITKPIAKPLLTVQEDEINGETIAFENEVIVEEKKEEIQEENTTTIINKVIPKLLGEENVTKIENEIEIEKEKEKENFREIENDNLTEVLIPHVQMPISVDDKDVKIKNFLDNYIEASAASGDKSLKFYDKHLKRYFRLKNATHKSILNSQKRYNKKWTKRKFKVSGFKIIKSYKKDKVNYIDIKTTTLWTVSKKKGKEYTGKSRGFMTLKEVKDSFIITSIHTLK